MSRSNSPLALSVVALTDPDSVEKTVSNITQFDDRNFGFNHNQTWAALPLALRGVLEPSAVASSFANEPVRIQRCITALCALGKELMLETRRFVDYPAAGLRTITPIEWDPNVTVQVKGCCWYVVNDQPVIPLLQPRKDLLSDERLSVYVRLGKQAYCQGDWIDAQIAIVDLAGEDDFVQASLLSERDIGLASDAVLARYVKTYIEAKRVADKARADRPAKEVRLPMDELLGSKK